MTQYELIKKVKKRKDVRTRDVDDPNEVNIVIRAFIEEMKNCLLCGDKLMFKDFFSLEINEIAPRKRRNPITGEIQDYPAAKNIKLRISNSLRDAINDRDEDF